MGIFNNRFAQALSMRKPPIDETDDSEIPQGHWQPGGAFNDAMTGADPLAPAKPLSLADKLNSIYKQNTTTRDQQMKELNTPLNEEDYQPSTGRKIAAALVGAAAGYGNPARGYELGAQVAGAPLANAKEQRNSRLKDLATAAGTERDKLGEALTLEQTGAEDDWKNKDFDLRNKDLTIRQDEAKDRHVAANDNHSESILQQAGSKKALETAGKQFHISDDGHGYIIDIANPDDKVDLGVMATTPEGKLKAAKDLATYTSNLDTSRQITVGNNLASNQADMQDKRDQAALERVRLRNESNASLLKERYKEQAAKDPTFKKGFDLLIQEASRGAAEAGVDVNNLINSRGAIPQVEEDSIFDSPKVLQLKKMLRDKLVKTGNGTNTVKKNPLGLPPPGRGE